MMAYSESDPAAEMAFPAPSAMVRDGTLAQQLLDSAPDAMVIVNESGQIVLVNLQTEKMFGYARRELLDQSVEMLIPEAVRDRHVQHRAAYCAEPRVRLMGQNIELCGRYRDGSRFPVEIMLSPLRIGGQLLVSSAIRDITERKIAETERQAQKLMLQRMLDIRSKELASASQQLHFAETMASIGTVAAGLVHDLNNALLPIRARLSAMRDQPCSPEAREHIHGLERTMDYIDSLCKRIRMLMAGDDDHGDDAATDLREWWREVEPLVSGALPRQIELKPEWPDDLPRVRVPRLDLTQAVFNLAHNAGRVMRTQGSGMVKIWAKASPSDHTVRLGVSDTGPGMSREARDHCLEPAYSMSKSGEGVGLGLMLVKSIVSRAHGTLDIESEPGRGTTFMLVLPATEEE